MWIFLRASKQPKFIPIPWQTSSTFTTKAPQLNVTGQPGWAGLLSTAQIPGASQARPVGAEWPGPPPSDVGHWPVLTSSRGPGAGECGQWRARPGTQPSTQPGNVISVQQQHGPQPRLCDRLGVLHALSLGHLLHNISELNHFSYLISDKIQNNDQPTYLFNRTMRAGKSRKCILSNKYNSLVKDDSFTKHVAASPVWQLENGGDFVK